ncbi:protein kinase [Nonomuraea ferruginea]
MDADSGRLIAKRYELVRALGRGGMGVVWEGHDTLLDRQCAVKEVVLPAGLPDADQERQLVRTAREARTAAQFNHPSVVAVYDVVEEDGRPWIIMELVRAPSVEEVVATMGALPVRQAADVGRQVLSALVAAHGQGILHRDVKPSNVLLTDDGRAVLTDFGIATAEGESSLTKTGMVTGSPGFLAPERVRGTEAGPASDLWSLGATLYATLVGRSPFERGEPMDTLKAILGEEPDYRRIPPIMHPVLQGLLRKDPAERVTAQEADELLDAVLQARPAAADRDAPGPPRVARARPRRRGGRRGRRRGRGGGRRRVLQVRRPGRGHRAARPAGRGDQPDAERPAVRHADADGQLHARADARPDQDEARGAGLDLARRLVDRAAEPAGRARAASTTPSGRTRTGWVTWPSRPSTPASTRTSSCATRRRRSSPPGAPASCATPDSGRSATTAPRPWSGSSPGWPRRAAARRGPRPA